jgi:hypothetical protein
MAFRKNSYFPRVSGVEEYCERQTPGLVFRSHCQFSDTGLDTRCKTGAPHRESGYKERHHDKSN